MIIYLGADHRGFELKEVIKKYLQDSGYSLYDKGNTVKDDNDDYPPIAQAVALEVGADVAGRRGVLVCGSGAGMAVAANKFPGIRSCMALSPDHAMSIKQEDDINILCLSADFLEPD